VVDFVSYSEHLDFTTPTGKLMVNIIAAFAQFERDLMSERIKQACSTSSLRGNTWKETDSSRRYQKVIDDYEKAKESKYPTSVRRSPREQK